MFINVDDFADTGAARVIGACDLAIPTACIANVPFSGDICNNSDTCPVMRGGAHAAPTI